MKSVLDYITIRNPDISNVTTIDGSTKVIKMQPNIAQPNLTTLYNDITISTVARFFALRNSKFSQSTATSANVTPTDN